MNHRDWYRITKGVLMNPRRFWEDADTEDKKHSTVYLLVTVLVHSVVVSGVMSVLLFTAMALGASDGTEVLGYEMGSVGMIGLILLGILGFVMSYTMFAFFFVCVPQFFVTVSTYAVVSAFDDTSLDASYQVISYATVGVATVYFLGYVALFVSPSSSSVQNPIMYVTLISYLNAVVPVYVLYLVYHGIKNLENLSRIQALTATVPLVLLFAPVYIGIGWTLLAEAGFV